jgi:hypothetical protein
VSRPSAVQPARISEARSRRDTLDALDRAFLRDQLRALLASPALAHGDRHHSEPCVATESDGEEQARDSQPSLDSQPNPDSRLLGEALRLGLK